MENYTTEIYDENYPIIISIEKTKKILEQMENSICKIYKNNGNKGTGFFCIIKYENKNIKVMVTNNHLIDDEYIKENDRLETTIDDDKRKIIIYLKNKIIYTNKEYDITIIEIKNEKINYFMNLDERYINNSNIIYENSIYLIQYPSGKKAGVSYGVINNINDFNIEYSCNTKSGSSGSPIINIKNNEIIGIHKGGIKNRHKNIGTLLKNPINDFIETKLKKSMKNSTEKKNEIEIIMKVEKKEINKKIYFLDNIDFEDEKKIKYYHNHLKELNDVDLYINDKKYKYKKYFKPEKEGIYKIRIKFNDITDCSFMFAGCENITNINFINFNTKCVKDMKYMFSGCSNLKYLDLSKFNTENVTNMEGMFGRYFNYEYLDLSLYDKVEDLKELINLDSKIKIYLDGCINLEEIILSSSFNTKNVTSMMGMFRFCKSLKKLNLPESFNTQNVTNMMNMFNCCYNLEKLILPNSFNTKNVIRMVGMFVYCRNLKELKLSDSFNTENVINMLGMFNYCNNLKELELPSCFNTKNVKNMMGMFTCCYNLEKLIFSASFNTKNAILTHMFYGCKYYDNFDLSSFHSNNKEILTRNPQNLIINKSKE